MCFSQTMQRGGDSTRYLILEVVTQVHRWYSAITGPPCYAITGPPCYAITGPPYILYPPSTINILLEILQYIAKKILSKLN